MLAPVFAAPLRRAARAGLDLLLPAGCASCEAPVAEPGQLCGDCFARISFVAEPLCLHCGLPFASRASAGPGRICATCIAAPPPWGRARAAMLYDAASRALILPFKHADRVETARTLAMHMHRAGAALLEGADLLVPVPLHRWRLLRRRYNQSALLAQEVSRRAKRPTCLDMLARVRATRFLSRTSGRDRARALAGAIEVRPNRRPLVAGRHIVLIDDVLTSGATAGACTRALLEAGAAQVDVLVASRVADPRVDRAAPREDDSDD